MDELEPARFDRSEAGAIAESLDELGVATSPPTLSPRPTSSRPLTARCWAQYAVVAGAASPAELDRARALLWKDLQETHGWEKNNPSTWKDSAFDNPTGGTTRAMEHADFIWYVRTLPGVLAGFAVGHAG